MSIRTCIFWQKIGKQCNYFNYFDCWKVEGAVNLEDVEDSVEKQPSLVGNLKKISRIGWGKVWKTQTVTLQGGKGTCKEEKEGLLDFHICLLFFHGKSHPLSSVFHKSNLRSCDFIEFARLWVLPEVKLHKFHVSRFEVQLACEAAVSTPRWYSL